MTAGKEKEKGINSIAELYRELHLPIYRYLFRLTGSSQMAEELTQETFYQALISVHRYKGRSKVSTWLYKIARNVYLNNIRAKMRKEKLEQKIIQELNQDPQQIFEPEVLFDQRLLEQKVVNVLQTLTEKDRTIIILKEVENLSHNEIAEIMGKTVTSTKVMLYRAKQKFQEKYQRLEGKQ